MTNHDQELKFRVGEKIVELGQVQRIFKVDRFTDRQGNKQVTLHYKPFYQSEKNETLEYSLPKANFKTANLRRPASKNKINKAIKILGEKPKEARNLSVADANTLLKENSPKDVARVLRLLWIEKQKKDSSLSTRKRLLYERILKRFTGEVAVVLDIGIREAKKKIINRLQKTYPEKKEETGN